MVVIIAVVAAAAEVVIVVVTVLLGGVLGLLRVVDRMAYCSRALTSSSLAK